MWKTLADKSWFQRLATPFIWLFGNLLIAAVVVAAIVFFILLSHVLEPDHEIVQH